MYICMCICIGIHHIYMYVYMHIIYIASIYRRNRPIQHPAIATFFHDFDDVGGGYLAPKETLRHVSFFHMPEWLGR